METNNHIPTYVSALSLVIKYSSLKYVEILLTEHSWGHSLTKLTKFCPLLTTYPLLTLVKEYIKVTKSQKQIKASSILPKNVIICFRDLLTFTRWKAWLELFRPLLQKSLVSWLGWYKLHFVSVCISESLFWNCLFWKRHMYQPSYFNKLWLSSGFGWS